MGHSNSSNLLNFLCGNFAIVTLGLASFIPLACPPVAFAETVNISISEPVCVPALDQQGQPLNKCVRTTTVNVNLNASPPQPYQSNQDQLKNKASEICESKETAEMKPCSLDGDVTIGDPNGKKEYTVMCYGNNSYNRHPDLCALINFKCKCTKVEKDSGGGVVIEHQTVTLSTENSADIFVNTLERELLNLEP